MREIFDYAVGIILIAVALVYGAGLLGEQLRGVGDATAHKITRAARAGR